MILLVDATDRTNMMRDIEVTLWKSRFDLIFWSAIAEAVLSLSSAKQSTQRRHVSGQKTDVIE